MIDEKFIEKLKADAAIARTDVLQDSLQYWDIYRSIMKESLKDMTDRVAHVDRQIEIMQKELESR